MDYDTIHISPHSLIISNSLTHSHALTPTLTPRQAQATLQKPTLLYTHIHLHLHSPLLAFTDFHPALHVQVCLREGLLRKGKDEDTDKRGWFWGSGQECGIGNRHLRVNYCVLARMSKRLVKMECTGHCAAEDNDVSDGFKAIIRFFSTLQWQRCPASQAVRFSRQEVILESEG